jgi:aminoglycoside 6'-N-acetyltransferase I
MRGELWPGSRDAHARQIARFFDGHLREPLAVLIAKDREGRAVGFAELSIRPYAEGCTTDHVGFLEGWYVEPDVRGRGIGRALIAASEEWARSQGCSEFASDAEVDNDASVAAHLALGFVDRGLVRCFSKTL